MTDHYISERADLRFDGLDVEGAVVGKREMNQPAMKQMEKEVSNM